MRRVSGVTASPVPRLPHADARAKPGSVASPAKYAVGVRASASRGTRPLMRISPSVGRMPADQGAQQRAFAGAVRARDPERLARTQLERHAAEGLPAALLHAEVPDRQQQARSLRRLERDVGAREPDKGGRRRHDREHEAPAPPPPIAAADSVRPRRPIGYTRAATAAQQDAARSSSAATSVAWPDGSVVSMVTSTTSQAMAAANRGSATVAAQGTLDASQSATRLPVASARGDAAAAMRQLIEQRHRPPARRRPVRSDASQCPHRICARPTPRDSSAS